MVINHRAAAKQQLSKKIKNKKQTSAISQFSVPSSSLLGNFTAKWEIRHIAKKKKKSKSIILVSTRKSCFVRHLAMTSSN